MKICIQFNKKNILALICLFLFFIYFIWFFSRLGRVLSSTPEADLVVMKIVKDKSACNNLVKWVDETRISNKRIGEENWADLIIINQNNNKNGGFNNIPSGYIVDGQIGSIEKPGISYSPLSNAVILPPDIEELALGKHRQIKVTISFDSLGYTRIDFDRSCIFVFSPGTDISSIPSSLVPNQENAVGSYPVIGFLYHKNTRK